MTVRFGIIGAGFIANTFASDAVLTEKCEVVAVSSRTFDKAKKFAETHHIEHVYEDYKEMLKNETIDAIYIASPHVYHTEHTLAALKAKKAVLCEKPFSMSSEDASLMIETAKEENVLLMEAMWTRFLPAYHKMKLLLERLGEIMFIKADFGIRPEGLDDLNRLFNPKLGGGALLDVGIYPISVVRDIMGRDPIKVDCTKHMSTAGVDLMSSYNYTFDNGALACLYSSIQVKTQTELFISGTEATIHISNFYCPENIIFTRHDGYQEAYNYPKLGYGYSHEISHFCDLYDAHKLESDVMPHKESLAVMEMIDKIKKEIGYLQS